MEERTAPKRIPYRFMQVYDTPVFATSLLWVVEESNKPHFAYCVAVCMVALLLANMVELSFYALL